MRGKRQMQPQHQAIGLLLLSLGFKKPRNMALYNKKSVKTVEFYKLPSYQKLGNPTALKGRLKDSFIFLN